MELVQVIVPALAIATLMCCDMVTRWQGAQARRAIALSRMSRYGEPPPLRTSPRLAAL